MDEVLIITGASRGIGAATARIAGRSGYAVCVNYLKNKAAAMKIVEEIKVDGGRALAVGADISREEEVVKLFRTVDDKLGKISALVNNAGILETQMRIEQMDAARLNRVFKTNITGSFLCAREAVKRMSTKTAEKVERLSMCHLLQQDLGVLENMWIMLLLKGRLILLPEA